MRVQREVQEVLMRMFPYTAARVKADIQRAACTDIGMHTPALWQKVAVCHAVRLAWRPTCRT